MANIELEEEEFGGQLTGDVFRRIVGLIRPHWKWVVVFTVAIMIVSVMDSLFTIINKNIIDQSVVGGDRDALWQLASWYVALVLFQRGRPGAPRP